MTACDNCGYDLGRLEVPREWDNSLVCVRCYDRLRAARIQATAAAQGERGADRQAVRKWKILMSVASLAAIVGMCILIYLDRFVERPYPLFPLVGGGLLLVGGFCFAAYWSFRIWLAQS